MKRYPHRMARWLSDEEQAAWRAYRLTVLLVDSALARDLGQQSGLSMPDYLVLSSLSETPGQRRRLTEMASAMQWSPSRLSHHVTRMQQRGLVERSGCSDDLRGAYVVLSEHGWDAIREAAPGHVESVREHLIGLLGADELAALTSIGDKVVAHFAGRCDGEPCQAIQSEKARPVSRS